LGNYNFTLMQCAVTLTKNTINIFSREDLFIIFIAVVRVEHFLNLENQLGNKLIYIYLCLPKIFITFSTINY